MLITVLYLETILISTLTKHNFWKLPEVFVVAIMALSAKFQAAVKVIQSLPKDGPYQPANNMRLRFYGLYKQATEGPCNIPKPAFYDIINRAKWDAWSKLGDLSSEDAMNGYIDELKNIVETMSFSGDVQNFLDSVGPFYEFVTLHGDEMQEIKDTIEKVTSSVSSSPSSSPDSSSQSSPLNDSRSRNINSVAENPILNGYLPNKAYISEKESVSSTYLPPSAPVHRRSIPHCSKDIQFQANGVYENGETSDEILEVDDETNPCHNGPYIPENVNSGTESDKYYSGDSEPDMEDKLVASVKTKDRAITKQQLSQSSELILENTVERLNRDVDHILARLRILEAAYASNGQITQGDSRLRRRRMFGELSRGSLTLIFSWPFVAYFIIKLISWWLARRRRRNNMLSLTN